MCIVVSCLALVREKAPFGSRCRCHDAAELAPDALKAANEMEFMARLVASYNVEGSGFGALFLKFTAPGIACNVDAGDRAATDKLKCCFLSYIGPVEVEPADMHVVPFTLTLACMGEHMPPGNSWVSCESGRTLLSDMCRQQCGLRGRQPTRTDAARSQISYRVGENCHQFRRAAGNGDGAA